MKFNEQLINLRRQKGLSQEQLGEMIGVSRQTVSKWELGDTTPEMEKLIQLSDIFDISMDALTGRDNNKGVTGGAEKFGSEGTDFHNNTRFYYTYGFRYEYKSRRTFRGLPLVHINIGRGIFKAKGVLAVGTIASGLISIGLVCTGLISLGMLSLGLISFGAISLGLLLSVGGISVGALAIGGLAIGILAIGGCAIGMYSMGGCAIAAKIAAGGYAQAPIAIGDRTSGQITFDTNQLISKGSVSNAILQKFPHTWKCIVNLFGSI